MKYFLTICFIPFAFAIILVVIISKNKQINSFLFQNTVTKDTTYIINNYISSFNNDATLENSFLQTPKNNKKTIHVIGSSELNSGIPELPHLFLTKNFNSNVISYGSAGNQCLSILCQLIAKEKELKSKKIVFIISPGWFESKFAKGTSSEVFLNYNSPRFLLAIANKNHKYAHYVRFRITQLFSEFSNPSLELKTLYFEYKNNQSVLHKLIFMPLLKATHFLIKEKKQLQYLQKTNSFSSQVKYIENKFSLNEKLNWTELLLQSKNDVESKVSNNKIGVNDEYFSAYIGKKIGRISAVK
jgi:poly-D-alanine transfer protein DltD